jgi:hypothetical protein
MVLPTTQQNKKLKIAKNNFGIFDVRYERVGIGRACPPTFPGGMTYDKRRTPAVGQMSQYNTTRRSFDGGSFSLRQLSHGDSIARTRRSFVLYTTFVQCSIVARCSRMGLLQRGYSSA